MRLALSTAAFFLFSFISLAQVTPAPTPPLRSCSITVGQLVVSTPLTGAPYAATEENTKIQTLADGTHIRQTTEAVRMFRDSQGRTRREQLICGSRPISDPSAVVVIIRDPVDGVGYILDTHQRIAHRYSGDARPSAQSLQKQRATAIPQNGLITESSRVVASSAAAAVLSEVQSVAKPNDHQVETESLGTQVIEGLTATGTRTITIIPVDAEGNDQSIRIVMDTWYSPELHTVILRSRDDPRSGQNTLRFKDISVTEPDPALFRPPADYKIVDETSPSVRIEYSF
jgi:hypothetical protein